MNPYFHGADFAVQQARNLYVVRGALDGAAARLAAANYTPHLVQRGRQLLDVGRRAVASEWILDAKPSCARQPTSR